MALAFTDAPMRSRIVTAKSAVIADSGTRWYGWQAPYG
jgi:hypothetical protein